jgi:hypothetical protein
MGAYARPNRARRQGGLSLRPNPRPRTNGFPQSKRQSCSPDEDEPEGPRKLLLTGGVKPDDGLVNGVRPKLFGGIPETWNVGRASRAGSPMSVS